MLQEVCRVGSILVRGNKIMVRTIFMLLLSVVAALSQQQDTVFQTVVLNRNSVGTFSVTRNIGQSAHLVAVVATQSSPPTPCVTIVATLSLRGSFDNVSWVTLQQVSINTVTGSAGDSSTSSFTATGSFPYLQVQILDIQNTSTCGVSLYYSGTLNIGTNSSNYPVRRDNFRTATGITGVGTGVNVGQCAGSATVAVYSLQVINQNATALGATARVYSLSNTFVDEPLLPLGNVQANATFILPNGPRPYAILFPSATYTTRDIWVDPGAAGQFRYSIVYRCE